jgi:hypothetical protein
MHRVLCFRPYHHLCRRLCLRLCLLLCLSPYFPLCLRLRLVRESRLFL